MEEKYKFETYQFGLTENSILLLRNKYNYKTIDLNDINSISIKKGRDIKSWLLALICGLGLFCYALYDIYTIYILFTDETGGVVYVERLLIPVFPLLTGIYLVITALRVTRVMRITVKSKQYYFSLRELIKKGKYDEFVEEIKKKFPEAIIS